MAEIKVPELGESITEATITKWLKKEGDAVQQGDLLLELETDKVNLEISADQGGVLGSISKGDGETVSVGETIGIISEGGAAKAPAPAAAHSSEPAAPSGAPAASDAKASVSKAESKTEAKGSSVSAASTTASPSARKLAREKGIDLSLVSSRDGSGRIYSSDVVSYSAQAAATQAAPALYAAPAAVPSPKVTEQPGKPQERVKMSRRRQTIAKRLVEAQQTAAMLTTFNEVDMTAILDIRKRRKQSFQEKNDVGLGFMSFFTKAVVGALKKFPLLNAEIDGDDIIVKKFYDIGIAVAAKEGLVVPVVRDADRLGFAEIEKSIADLAARARANTLALGDLQGGTFTITNGGVFGSLLSTPILNAPQVGILGMHKIQLRPVAIDEERYENRPMMYIALSYDHRIVDGAEAVRFLVTVKELLEDPETLLLEG